MRKFLSSVIIVPLLVLAVAFLVANRQMVVIGFDPFSTDSPAMALGPMPLWAALMGALFLGYLSGAVVAWRAGKGGRHKAAVRKKELKTLRKEVALAGRSDARSGEGEADAAAMAPVEKAGMARFLPALPHRQRGQQPERPEA